MNKLFVICELTRNNKMKVVRLQNPGGFQQLIFDTRQIAMVKHAEHGSRADWHVWSFERLQNHPDYESWGAPDRGYFNRSPSS